MSFLAVLESLHFETTNHRRPLRQFLVGGSQIWFVKALFSENHKKSRRIPAYVASVTKINKMIHAC